MKKLVLMLSLCALGFTTPGFAATSSGSGCGLSMYPTYVFYQTATDYGNGYVFFYNASIQTCFINGTGHEVTQAGSAAASALANGNRVTVGTGGNGLLMVVVQP